MAEKMVMAIEAALFRVVYESLRKIDATYPNRVEDATEFALHMQCVKCLMSWYYDQLFALRASFTPVRENIMRRRPTAALTAPGSDLDDWGDIAAFFLSAVAINAVIELSALPLDVAQILRMTAGIVELAVNGRLDTCMRELRTLADTLQRDPKSRGIGGIASALKITPKLDKASIESQSRELANRMKQIMKIPPKPPTKKPSPP